MGRRKERRLAAMAAAGRRVKLDLFAGPSPGEESLQEEVGGNLNRDQQTGVATSPSSSDKEQDNPLSLLGQYSDDDEAGEEETEQPNGAIKDSSTNANAQVIQEGNDSAGDKGDAKNELAASCDVQQESPKTESMKNLTDVVPGENSVAPQPTQECTSAPATQDLADSSGMQIVGDVDGNWKVAMHEQSNQCYYWNTVTGETSWEMPNGLASNKVAADGIASMSVTGQMDYPMESEANTLTHNNIESQQSQANVLTHNTLPAYPSNIAIGNSCTSAYANVGMECGSGQITHDAYAYSAVVATDESMDIDPMQLVKYGEDLLHRLKLLGRPHASFENLECIRREIEIRISDCNALFSYGSSLLPLWLHAEVHLKQLESSIANMEASCHTEPKHEKTEASERLALDEAAMVASSVGEDSKFEAHSGVSADENVKNEEPSAKSSVQNLEGEKEATAFLSKVESEDEDVDMDVEMEVDDENVERHEFPSSVPNSEPPTTDQVESSNIASERFPAPPEDTDIPPPPEEEWIPPPPPENEPTPPPPPEEPVVSYAHVDAIQPSFQAQPSLSYAFPTTEYYATASTEDASVNYYVQPTASHVLQPQQLSYYVPVSTSATSAPVNVTSVDPISYYSFTAAAPSAPAVVAELSGYYASSVAASSGDTLGNQSSVVSAMSASSSLPPAKLEPSNGTVSAKPHDFLAKEPSVVSTSQALESTSEAGSSAQASANSSNQTKVVRGKKRSVAVSSSLRSNKKVSSLVDKWNAAKEELHGEDDEEPESALDAFERKRQKEIDAWRKRQIASGEAQENVNFVPLGGDWRERIKRRRAAAKSERQSELSPPAGAAEQEEGQPDLAHLSKGLPPGWQAYLDDSSKQVYYGNALTSETTWDRPTKCEN